MTMNRDALIRAHQNNIKRYCRLLATHLTDVERKYVHRRLVEVHQQLEKLLNPPAGKSVLAPKEPAHLEGNVSA
jgi:hypothetical protein